MQNFITIIYIIVALVMVLSILLQAGKGGGLGSALGGGASQGVFGGGGGADFMSKLTQGFAATFMICAMYLAYASAHAGSDLLAAEGKPKVEELSTDDSEVDYEFVGVNPQRLLTPEQGRAKQAAASAMVPAQSEVASEAADREPVEIAEDPEADAGDAAPSENDDNLERGDSPDEGRSDSPQGGKESLQDPSGDQDTLEPAKSDSPALGSDPAAVE